MLKVTCGIPRSGGWPLSRVPSPWKWRRSSSLNSPKVHNGINPSDKTKLWDVSIATEHDLDDAVRSGQEAFKKWSKTTWKDRQDILLQMVKELLSHRDEMAQLILKECGKPVR